MENGRGRGRERDIIWPREGERGEEEREKERERERDIIWPRKGVVTGK